MWKKYLRGYNYKKIVQRGYTKKVLFEKRHEEDEGKKLVDS